MAGASTSSIPVELREYAAAIDKDRGHDKSAVTCLMRASALEIERLRKVVARVESEAPDYIKRLVRD